MIHLTEKRFTLRAGTVPQIKAYTNAAQAELLVNGKSRGFVEHGETEALPTVFVWEQVKIDRDRENEITVKAYFSDGTVLEDGAIWQGY